MLMRKASPPIKSYGFMSDGSNMPGSSTDFKNYGQIVSTIGLVISKPPCRISKGSGSSSVKMTSTGIFKSVTEVDSKFPPGWRPMGPYDCSR